MKKTAFVLLTLAATLAAVSCGKNKTWLPQVKLEGEKPEVKVQRQITAVLRADDDAKFHREMASLLDLSAKLNWDNRRLVQETIDYGRKIQDKDEMARYCRVLEALHIARTTIVDAAGSRLDSSQGYQAETAQALLRFAAPPDPRGHADFSHFAPYLETHRAQPPARLILWMYDRDPAAALWQMAAAAGEKLDAADLRDVTLSEHVISEILWRQERGLLKPDEFDPAAIEHIEKLAAQKPWYVRLYVAQIVTQHPKLQKPAVVEQLRADPSPLVQQVMQRTGK